MSLEIHEDKIIWETENKNPRCWVNSQLFLGKKKQNKKQTKTKNLPEHKHEISDSNAHTVWKRYLREAILTKGWGKSSCSPCC